MLSSGMEEPKSGPMSCEVGNNKWSTGIRSYGVTNDSLTPYLPIKLTSIPTKPYHQQTQKRYHLF